MESAENLFTDIMINPATGYEDLDTFRVMSLDTTPEVLPFLPPSRTVPRTLHPRSAMRLEQPVLLGKPQVPASEGPLLRGETVLILLKTGAALVVSSSQSVGAQKQAIIAGRFLDILVGSQVISIESKSSVIDRPGAWFAWVRPARSEEVHSAVYHVIADFSH